MFPTFGTCMFLVQVDHASVFAFTVHALTVLTLIFLVLTVVAQSEFAAGVAELPKPSCTLPTTQLR
jgi:hypothetical protein